MPGELTRLFQYDHLANNDLLTFLDSAPSAPRRAWQLLAHIHAAQDIWLSRLEGTEPTLPVWPELTALELQTWSTTLRDRWQVYLERSHEAEAIREITYRNFKGQEFTSRADDIVSHVLLHGAYHRGQIATHLRHAGLEPPATDFIFAARTGRL